MSTTETEQSARDAVLLNKLRAYMGSEDMSKKVSVNPDVKCDFILSSPDDACNVIHVREACADSVLRTAPP